VSTLQNQKLYKQIVNLLQEAKQQVLQTVNQTMVITYFEIGRMIVEEEQKGEERAKYGKSLLKIRNSSIKIIIFNLTKQELSSYLVRLNCEKIQ